MFAVPDDAEVRSEDFWAFTCTASRSLPACFPPAAHPLPARCRDIDRRRDRRDMDRRRGHDGRGHEGRGHGA